MAAMRAKTLVDLMLEAAPRGAVLAFGYGAPVEGFYGNKVDDVVNDFKSLKLIDVKMPVLDALNELIQKQNAAFIVKKGAGDIHVYSRSTPLALEREGKDRIGEVFGIDPDNGSVAWSRNFGTSAQRRPSGDVFGVVKERKQRELEKEHHSQREILRQMVSQHIPEAEETPLNARYQPRVTLGFDYDARSNNGIRVVAVKPNTPAARAGLTAGDVVYTIGPYTSSLRQGQPGQQYRLKTAQHLTSVLSELDPGVPVPIGVLRGDGSLRLAIVPEKQ